MTTSYIGSHLLTEKIWCRRLSGSHLLTGWNMMTSYIRTHLLTEETYDGVLHGWIGYGRRVKRHVHQYKLLGVNERWRRIELISQSIWERLQIVPKSTINRFHRSLHIEDIFLRSIAQRRQKTPKREAYHIMHWAKSRPIKNRLWFSEHFVFLSKNPV